MSWIKNSIIDIIVTVFIVVAVSLKLAWAPTVLYVYSGLMLLLKVGALFAGSLLQMTGRQDSQPPAWFFHLLYAVSFGALLYARWWILAAIWAAIWVLSMLLEVRQRREASAPARRSASRGKI